MLHLVNGDSTAGTLRESGIAGEIFSFKDALIDGPAPAGLSAEEWRGTRAQHLADGYEVQRLECEERLRKQEAVLARSLNEDEVVLWFEHDLFCQLNLLYLLDWFAHADFPSTHLSLINIGQFPGRPNFRGLGELSPQELVQLFPRRQSVTRAQLQLGASAWQAFTAAEPTVIEDLLKSDTSAMPFLSTAFLAHLQRFPATGNGLNRVERRSLQLIDEGLENFVDLFPKFLASESVYGFGDAQLWLTLLGLSSVSEPLVTINSQNGARTSQEQTIHKSSFALTEAGRAVLAGKADFIELNGIDKWLGGVHLIRQNVWRWNQATARLER